MLIAFRKKQFKDSHISVVAFCPPRVLCVRSDVGKDDAGEINLLNFMQIQVLNYA